MTNAKPRRRKWRAPPPPTNGPPRPMLSARQVLRLVPVHANTLRRWVQGGKFPTPVTIGANSRAWYADEVAAWQREQRDRERRGPAPTTGVTDSTR